MKSLEIPRNSEEDSYRLLGLGQERLRCLVEEVFGRLASREDPLNKVFFKRWNADSRQWEIGVLTRDRSDSSFPYKTHLYSEDDIRHGGRNMPMLCHYPDEIRNKLYEIFSDGWKRTAPLLEEVRLPENVRESKKDRREMPHSVATVNQLLAAQLEA